MDEQVLTKKQKPIGLIIGIIIIGIVLIVMALF